MKLWISLLLLIVAVPSTQGNLSEEKETVILLHGLGRTHRSMKRMERYFEKQGYIVHNLGYSSRKKSIEELVNGFFAEKVNEIAPSAKKVHFIGHSLGGILVRSYLQDRKIPNLGRIVMLSPPNQGCHVTDKLKKWSLYRSFTGKAGQELGTTPDSWPMQLKEIDAEVGIITGNRSGNWYFSYLIPGPDDGKIAVEDAKLPEMKDFMVLPLNHTVIMLNDEVFIQSEQFIKNGKFDPSLLPIRYKNPA